MFTPRSKKHPRQKGLEPAARKALLIHKGVTLTSIAKAEQVHVSYISNHIAGRRKNRKIRASIAKKMGLPYVVVWGSERQPRKTQ